MEREELTREEPELEEEEDCKPLTDEEFKAYQEKDERTTNRVLNFFGAIWDAISFFS